MPGIIIPDPRGGLVGIHAWDGTQWQKVGIFVADSALKTYITNTPVNTIPVQNNPNDLTVACYGWDGTYWQKLQVDASYNLKTNAVNLLNPHPVQEVKTNLETYSDTVYQRIEHTASAGAGWINGNAVPAGEVWVITSAFLWNISGSSTTYYYIAANMGGTNVIIAQILSPARWEGISFSGRVVLKAGDYLRGRYTGATAGDVFWFTYSGYKVDV